MKHLWLLLILILIIPGCRVGVFGFTMGKIDEDRLFRPKYPRFKLEGELKGYEGDYLVDTNAVYLRRSFGKYFFMRFFPDGQVFHSFQYDEMPDTSDFYKIQRGNIGYYIFKDGYVIREGFGWREGGSYFTIKYKVQNDTLINYKYRTHAFFIPIWRNVSYRYYYNKIPLENLEGEPTW